MSRFYGKYHEGYLREVRFDRRYEAYGRILEHQDIKNGTHAFVLTELAGGKLVFLCEEEGCTQLWDPSRRHRVPTSSCPWVKQVKPDRSSEKQKRHQMSSS